MLIRLIGMLSIFFLIACSEAENKESRDHEDYSEITVQVHQITKEFVPRFYSATGYTNVSRSIEISTSQSATIDTLTVKEGDIVEQGMLLIALDQTELLTSIRRAESAINSAKIRLKDLAHDLSNARQLREKKVITIEQLRKAKVQHNLAETQLQQAESELERQLARKPYHQIHSPIKARVIKKWVNQGDLAVIGKPLLQLEAIGGLEFDTALPAKWINSINIGDSYQIDIHDRKQSVDAVVSHIVNSVDRATQTIQIKLALPDSSNVEAGLSGQVDFTVDQEESLLVEESALVKRGGVFGVYRIEQVVGKLVDNLEWHRVIFTPVNFERKWQNKYVVLSGLEVKDKVVINPTSNLRDGTRVIIKGSAKLDTVETKKVGNL